MYSGLYGTVFVKKSPVQTPGIFHAILWFTNSTWTIALCNDIRNLIPSICTPEALLMAYRKSWQKLLTLSLKCGILPLERYSKENASRRKNILRIIYEIWSRRSGRRYFRWSL